MNNTKLALWTPGDWNAFFGFGTNILVNLLTLTGLLPFTTYYYQIAQDPSYNQTVTQTNTLTTARAAGDMTPFKLDMIGDMGTLNGGPTTAALIQDSNSAEFILQVGDMSYADDAGSANPPTATEPYPYETIYEVTRHLNRVTTSVFEHVFDALKEPCPFLEPHMIHPPDIDQVP